MRRITQILYLLFSIFIGNAGVALADTNELDLSTAISIALTRNKKLISSLLAIKSALINLEDARLPFEFKIHPAVSASTDGDKKETSAEFSVSRKLVWGTDVKLSTTLLHNQQNDYTNLYQGIIKAEISQPLIKNAGKEVTLDALIRSENRVKDARRLLEMQKMDILVAVVESYIALLQLKQEMISSEKALERMEKLFQLTNAKERMGTATRIDTLRAELQLRQTDSSFKELKERYVTKMRDFNELLGVELTNVFKLSPVPVFEEQLPEYDAAIDTALSNRLDYALQLEEFKETERGVNVGQNRLLPDFGIFVNYEYSGENTDAYRLKSYDSIWFAGVRIQTELGRSSQKVDFKRALNEKEIASNKVELLKISIMKQVGQQLSECRRATEQMRLAQQNLNVASSRLKLARKMFEIGRGDLFTVTDAESAFLEAERKFFSEQSGTIVAHYRLRRVLGTLLEVADELKPQKKLQIQEDR